MNGSGVAALDPFKARADETSNDLNLPLAMVTTGRSEMNMVSAEGMKLDIQQATVRGNFAAGNNAASPSNLAERSGLTAVGKL